MTDAEADGDGGGSRVTLQPSGRQFTAWPGQSLLEAGLGAGLALPFRCSNGSCGDCRARVTSGSVVRLRQHDYLISERDKLAGLCLMCSNAADGPVELEVQEALTSDDIPLQTLKAKRCHLESASGVLIARFRFVRGKAFRFLPGQSACLQLPDGQSACLPIASCPCDTAYVEFHIPLLGACAAPALADAITRLGERDRVDVTGPSGHFTIGTSLVRPQLFLAVGIGFAAVQGLIEHFLTSDPAPRTTLLWTGNDGIGHYRANLCRAWADAFDEFTCHLPVDESASTAAAMPPGADVYVAAGADALLQALLDTGYTPGSITQQAHPDRTGA